MSKYNRVTQAVFADIVGTDDRISLFERFLSTDKTLGIVEDDSLRECKRLYNNIITTLKSDVEVLSRLEEIIIQIRCRETLDSHIKLSTNSKGYVYARCLFFRHNRDVKDIRVLVGHEKVLTTETESLSIGRVKLIEAMNKEIKDTMTYLRKINN